MSTLQFTHADIPRNEVRLVKYIKVPKNPHSNSADTQIAGALRKWMDRREDGED